MEKLGAKIVHTVEPEGVIVDKHFRLITTQGFNSNSIKPHQVFTAIENMVNATVDYVDNVVEGEVSKNLSLSDRLLKTTFKDEEIKSFKDSMAKKSTSRNDDSKKH